MKTTILILTISTLSFPVFSQFWNLSGASVTTTTAGDANVGGGLSAGGVSTGILNMPASTSYINMSNTLGTGYKLYSENTNSHSNGFANFVTNTVTGTQFGFRNSLVFSGTAGSKYGFYNTISTPSASISYGIYNTIGGTGDGIRYGVYSRISQSGAGTKYGVYSQVVNSGTSELRYGIYADAQGTGSKAGYFLGDLETKGKVILTQNAQGRFTFITTSLTNLTMPEQSLSIRPNNTANQDDWDDNRSLTFYNNGLLQKRMNTANDKAFTVYRTDLGEDVFKVKSNGVVYATEINVQLIPFPDYVFHDDYDLMPLSQVKEYISSNGHLPNVPTAEVVESEGANLGEMTKILVEKVEELTLYLLDQDEKLKSQTEKLNQQQSEIEELKLQLNSKK